MIDWSINRSRTVGWIVHDQAGRFPMIVHKAPGQMLRVVVDIVGLACAGYPLPCARGNFPERLDHLARHGGAAGNKTAVGGAERVVLNLGARQSHLTD